MFAQSARLRGPEILPPRVICAGAGLPARARLFMGGAMTDTGLSQLGHAAAIPSSPDQAVLERAPNPHPGTLYLARFTAPEFTSICPVTGQPDFGVLVIDYAPRDWIVESKSLKIFLQSFRNHGAFHEDCTVGVAKRIVDAIAPTWLRIGSHSPAGASAVCQNTSIGMPPRGFQ